MNTDETKMFRRKFVGGDSLVVRVCEINVARQIADADEIHGERQPAAARADDGINPQVAQPAAPKLLQHATAAARALPVLAASGLSGTGAATSAAGRALVGGAAASGLPRNAENANGANSLVFMAMVDLRATRPISCARRLR